MAKVVSVERIENFGLWQKYQTQRAVLLKFLESNNASVDNLSAKTRWRPKFASTKDLSSEINEFYLFHGTSFNAAHNDVASKIMGLNQVLLVFEENCLSTVIDNSTIKRTSLNKVMAAERR